MSLFGVIIGGVHEDRARGYRGRCRPVAEDAVHLVCRVEVGNISWCWNEADGGWSCHLKVSRASNLRSLRLLLVTVVRPDYYGCSARLEVLAWRET